MKNLKVTSMTDSRNIGYIKTYLVGTGTICKYWNNDGEYFPMSKESTVTKKQWEDLIDSKKAIDEKIKNGIEISDQEIKILEVFTANLRSWQEFLN